MFALSGDDELRAFVNEMRNSRRLRDNQQVLESGDTWKLIHRCLSDGTLDPQGGEFPLDHCILGGKQMHSGDGYVASLVRPDVAPHVAEALAKVRLDEMNKKYFALDPASIGHEPTDEEFTEMWNMFKLVREFFADAATDRNAVLFAAEL